MVVSSLGLLALKWTCIYSKLKACQLLLNSWNNLIVLIFKFHVTYQFNQAVVRVEVPVYDAHRMKVRLKQRRKSCWVKFTHLQEKWSSRSKPFSTSHDESVIVSGSDEYYYFYSWTELMPSLQDQLKWCTSLNARYSTLHLDSWKGRWRFE